GVKIGEGDDRAVNGLGCGRSVGRTLHPRRKRRCRRVQNSFDHHLGLTGRNRVLLIQLTRRSGRERQRREGYVSAAHHEKSRPKVKSHGSWKTVVRVGGVLP